MVLNKWPKISIITPTLNSSRTIKYYFDSINKQLYEGEIEIIVVDGGSNDDTLNQAKTNNAKIYSNKLVTAESGKSLGIKKATGDIVLFIDSDNVLPEKLWLKKMIFPLLKDETILASEPIRFSYRKNDHWLTRYFALLGMGDPLNLFIGNYDRYSYVTNRWTNIRLTSKKFNGYIKTKLEYEIPTIGANGFVIRKKVFDQYQVDDYLFDIDLLKKITKEHPIFVAKVNVGIIHLFSGDIKTFVRKQSRRIRDYLYYKKDGKREDSFNNKYLYWGIFKFIISCFLVIPLILQTIRGYMRKKDAAWLFHPFSCYITLIVYVYESVRSIVSKEKYDRTGWKQ